MPATSLERHCVERIWGRTKLPEGFADGPSCEAPIGEVWYSGSEAGSNPLLVKYLFTSERLSIQVHPDDQQARALGFPRGKDEAWLVLEAEPEAVIGLGLNHAISRDELRASAISGEIEQLVNWRPVRSGDFIYSPAGTIHAIGGGLSLVEIQQNLDLTYRLYDYGRPRELHLDAGVAVARPERWSDPGGRFQLRSGREIIASGGAFVVERWNGQSGTLSTRKNEAITLVPLGGDARLDGREMGQGSVWLVRGDASLKAGTVESELLVAYAGADVQDELLR